MKTAFKEWAVVCRALGTGRQVLILRKGGIGEQAGKFRPEHCEFLFFPTGFHQSTEQVLPEAHRLLREAEADQPPADRRHTPRLVQHGDHDFLGTGSHAAALTMSKASVIPLY